jgi:hypothetical protein
LPEVPQDKLEKFSTALTNTFQKYGVNEPENIQFNIVDGKMIG